MPVAYAPGQGPERGKAQIFVRFWRVRRVGLVMAQVVP